jgi:hypothetical protein
MPNTKQNHRRMQGEKRGQEPIAERPDWCFAILVPDPFSEPADSRSIRVFGKNVCCIFAQRAADSRNKREPLNKAAINFYGAVARKSTNLCWFWLKAGETQQVGNRCRSPDSGIHRTGIEMYYAVQRQQNCQQVPADAVTRTALFCNSAVNDQINN